MYRRERSLQEDMLFTQRRRTPSFSSSLLDAVYRSIDESNAEEAHFKETCVFKKQSISSSAKRGTWLEEEEKEVLNLRRIDDWMEKRSIHSSVLYNSASSSSESSSGATFSSSETESSDKHKPKPKPKLRSSKKQTKLEYWDSGKQPKSKIEGGFTKTKLQALKIYEELKKVKQPISPGGRIASFLNSIFNSDNVKKAKMCYVGAVEDVNLEPKSKSACSSAASHSRSCLSKSPASRGKLSSNGIKRSVRFYPLSVIVGEDSQPCGHKCIHDEDPTLMPMPTLRKITKTRSVKESTSTYHLRGFGHNGKVDNDDDDDDDTESCSSSDLFELDHLVGIGRYREELPVYETTNLETNQAIAKGLIL
ncbi:protein BIG GRAIN 1-like A [Carya illinoinensis]|uniref:Protein BIG GRAIN 1-like A n=1 Tax=Carya illinoinensis TaxID=32201 RepID=A0A8T1R5W7_CARIL|nr:protein BIG GRAIN 1-like A [Carya illinoinensis]KAG6661939.1 hypothetical protein CIPAW_03G210100 [Carya illinoinensis]